MQSNHRTKLEHFWLDDEVGKLHPAEQKLLECVSTGEVCEIANERPVAATRENNIRSSFLRFLILGGDKNVPVHERGVRLGGAFIDCGCSKGCFDLEGATINHDIGLVLCEFDGDIILRGCKAKTISLEGSKIHSLRGDRMEVSGSVLLRNQFQASGEVRLLSAKITGALDCINASLLAPGSALQGDRMEVGGSIFLHNGFKASGTVRFSGAKITGGLACDNAELLAPDNALLCDGLEVGGGVFLRNGFHSAGAVRLLSVKITGDLDCRNGYFAAIDVAISAQNIQIGGNVFIDHGFQATGEVDFRNARIGGQLECDDAIFSCKNQSLVFNRAVIDGMVLLGKGLMSAGQISFAGAKIGRDFSVQGVSLEGNPSLQLRNAEIRGTLTWRGIKYAHGQLDLTGVTCRDFSFDEYSWKKPKEIKLTDFAYKSFTELPKGADGDFWREWLERQPKSHLQTKFRPKPYEYLADILSDMGNEEESRAVRIAKQKQQTEFIQKYQPRPKKPVARMLRRLNIFWRRAVLGPFVDYGYRPGRAGLYLIGIGLVGAFIYWWAAAAGIITPANPLVYKEAHLKSGLISPECKDNWVYVSKNCAKSMPSEHSEFQPFWYSFDVLLPVVNLRQQDDWSPRVAHENGSNWWAGRLVRWWEWFQISAGWVLSLLFVSAIGGIIKR